MNPLKRGAEPHLEDGNDRPSKAHRHAGCDIGKTARKMQKRDRDGANRILDGLRDALDEDQICEFLISHLDFTFASDLYDFNSFPTESGGQ